MNSANQSYEAYAFNSEFGNEVVAGLITVDSRGLHFTSEAVQLSVPAMQLQVRFGTGTDERIYFQDSTAPDWEIYTDDFSILNHPRLPQGNELRASLSNNATKQEVKRRLRLIGYVFAVIALITWLVNLSVGLMVDALVARIPPTFEQELGKSALEEMETIMTLVTDSNRIAHLERVVAPLTKAFATSTNGLQFFIAEESDPNAFALPGGYVIVTTGMLKLVARPEELLGVIAHELAHVQRKHGIRTVISQAGPFLIFGVMLGSHGGVVGLLGNAADLVVRSGFSQKYETEADELGWELLVKAKVDPRGMIDVFRKLEAYEKQQRDLFDLPEAFHSHPAVEKRIKRLEKKWQKLSLKPEFQNLSELTPALRAASAP